MDPETEVWVNVFLLLVYLITSAFVLPRALLVNSAIERHEEATKKLKEEIGTLQTNYAVVRSKMAKIENDHAALEKQRDQLEEYLKDAIENALNGIVSSAHLVSEIKLIQHMAKERRIVYESLLRDLEELKKCDFPSESSTID